MSQPEQHLVGLTVSMHPANMVQTTMTIDGQPAATMALDRASTENVIAGLQTHLSYLKQEKFDA